MQKYSSHNYGSAIIFSYTVSTERPIYVQIQAGGWAETTLITNTDLGGAVFQPASGNIKYGMNGIYIGAFSNVPLQSDGTAFEACIYLIATKGWLTVAYVFPITQYSEGHLFFNRMNHNNAWELSSWKKLIA